MNRCVRSFSASCSSFAFTLVIAVLLLAASLGLAPPLQATAIAMGSVQVTNFTITPSTGTVVFTDLWTAQAFAEAQNSLCGCDSQFNSSLGGTAMADAMVMFAAGHSFADAAALDLSAAATVNISGGIMAANAIGQATLFNTTFSITGGSGPVDVTFSAMLNIAQMLFTDASGVFAGTDASYSLSLDGQNVLFMDSSNQVGPSSSWSDSFSGDLSDTITLDFDQNYSLFAVAETDPYGNNFTPEPPTGMLSLLGMSVPLIRRFLMSVRKR